MAEAQVSGLPTAVTQGQQPTFICPVCLEVCPRAEVFVTSGCNHEFCRECARGVVLNAVR